MIPRKFASAKDAWLMALLWLVIIATVGSFLPALAKGSFSTRSWVFIIDVLSCWLLLSIMYQTYYVITDDQLLIRSSFLSIKIKISDITDISPSKSLLSSPALSLDRIAVSHSKGQVLISPKDREAFLTIVAALNPSISMPGLFAGASTIT